MRRFALAAAFSSLLLAPGVRAATVDGIDIPAVSAGVNVSSLGIGPAIDIHDPGSVWGARLGFDLFDVGGRLHQGGVRYKTNAHMSSGGVTADYYPLGNGLRVSLGLLLDRNSIYMHGRALHQATINGHVYPADDLGVISGTEKFNPVAPYAGLGYTTSVYGPVEVSFDAGVLYQGAGLLNLRSDAQGVDEVLRRDLAAESTKVRHDFGIAEFYPVAILAVAYRF